MAIGRAEPAARCGSNVIWCCHVTNQLRLAPLLLSVRDGKDMTKSVPGICGKPRKLMPFENLLRQVANCLSQPARRVKLSPAATG